MSEEETGGSMKNLVLARIALLLVLAGAASAALLTGRTAAAGQDGAAKARSKTEVVALEVATRTPLRHARCRGLADV